MKNHLSIFLIWTAMVTTPVWSQSRPSRPRSRVRSHEKDTRFRRKAQAMACQNKFNELCSSSTSSQVECGQCAMANKVDLGAAGCTRRIVNALCRSQGDGDSGSACGEELDTVCPSSSVTTTKDCGKCAMANRDSLETAGCTRPIVTAICQSRGGDDSDSTCREELDAVCPSSSVTTAKDCGQCAMANQDRLSAAGCTPPVVQAVCKNRKPDLPVPPTVLPPGTTSNPLQVFIQAGQSGCGGAASSAMMNDDDNPSYDKLKGSVDNVWFAGFQGGARNGPERFYVGPMVAGESSRNGDSFGPEVPIGNRIAEGLGGDVEVLMVKYCWGGSNMFREWNPRTTANNWDRDADDGTAQWLLEETVDLFDKDSLYANLIYTVRRALEALDEGGVVYDLAGFFWLQGSADKDRTWRQYGEDTVAMFEALRLDLDAPTLPIVDESTIHHNLHTGKVWAASVMEGCQATVATFGMGAPDPDDTECTPGPSNPCLGSTFINFDVMNHYGYDPVINEPEFAFLKPPGASNATFYWFKNFPYDQHLEYEGKVLQGRMMANQFLREFTNYDLRPEWILDDMQERFPLLPCDPAVNDGKPSDDHVCWMDLRDDSDRDEATCEA